MQIPYYFDAAGVIHTRDPHRFPAKVQLLPEAMSQETITPANVILHTNSAPHRTKWWDLFRYLLRGDVTIEPHFQVTLSGHLVQLMPITKRADCNAQANAWSQSGRRLGAISFETQDNGAAPLASTPWTRKQIRTLSAAVAAIAADERSIVQLRACAGPFDSGVGYHSQFSQWSIYRGKTCPGPARITQVPEIITTAQGYAA